MYRLLGREPKEIPEVKHIDNTQDDIRGFFFVGCIHDEKRELCIEP
jgi:hypothetical protein